MTIAVFPLIFPAGIVLSIVAYQFVHPYVLVDLSVLSPEEYGTTALATSVVLGGDQAGWSASVTVRDSPNLSLQWLGAAYEAAFTTAELVREGFISVIQLDPLDDTLYNFYKNLNKHYF